MNRYDNILEKVPTKIYIFFIAFLVAPLIYLFIATNLRPDNMANSYENEIVILYAFPIVSLATIVGGYLFKNLLVKRIPLINSRETFDNDFKNNLHVPMIIYLAFFESVSIYGFIGYIMGGDMTRFVVYVVLSMALMILNRPTVKYFNKQYEYQRELIQKGVFKKKSLIS